MRRWLIPLIFAAMAGAAAGQERTVPQDRGAVRLSFAPVVERVVPSVVNVYATSISASAVSPFAGDPFFERFFGFNSPFFGTRPRESRSLGSGVIVDPSGVILTNSHVVSGATDIRVSTADNREFHVDLILDDPRTDLAVLRVREPGGRTFPALEFADSDNLLVGDLVLAVGNPFGVGQTVTSGIVSALARTTIEATDYQFFIQTDAAINPGNSGGALVDVDGRLVGINTAIFTRTGGSVGIGFAIPANMARVVARAGLAGGTLERAWFGARLQNLTAELADSLRVDPPTGALITEVAPGGPAEAARLQPGDVIVAIDGMPVTDPQEFAYRFATRDLDATATLRYLRNGAASEAAIAIEGAGSFAGPSVEIGGNTRFAGASGAELNAAFADEFGLPYDSRGVVITGVGVGSPAERLGLRRGDILLSIQGQEILTVDDFKRFTAGRPRAWQIILQREGRVIRSIVEG